MDCSPRGSSVHGILQARILEWVAISSSRGSSCSRDETCVSCIGRQVLYHLSLLGSPQFRVAGMVYAQLTKAPPSPAPKGTVSSPLMTAGCSAAHPGPSRNLTSLPIVVISKLLCTFTSLFEAFMTPPDLTSSVQSIKSGVSSHR